MANWTTPGVITAGDKGVSSLLQAWLSNNLSAFPIGGYMYMHRATGGDAVETTFMGKWIECNGASVLQATYPALFAIIGTTYGSVDGTHFTLPNLQGRMLVPAAGAGGHADVTTLGNTEGAVLANRRPTHTTTNTLTTPTHAHPFSVTISTGVHSHTHTFTTYTINSTQGGIFPSTVFRDVFSAFTGDTSGSGGGHSHTYSSPSVGSSTTGITLGPGANAPTNTPGYLVGGVWMVSYV